MDDRLSNDLASLRIDRNEPPRSSGRALRWVAGVLVVGALGVAAWRVGMPAIEARVFQTEVALTEIAVVSPAQAQVQLTSTGYVVPQVTSDIASKVLGRVTRVHIKEGDRVKTGQVLIDLDPSDQRSLVASAQARVAGARARVATAKAQLAEIVQQRDREKRLADTGAVSQATADDLAARATSLEEQVKAAEADVAASQAEVAALGVNLDNFTIRALIDGTVLAFLTQPGDVMSPGVAVSKIADFSSILVETDVPETRLQRAKVKAPCEIVLDAYPDKRWRGEVASILPQLNRAKASATVKVRFLDRDDTVLPEMSARVSFLDAPLDAAKLAEPPKKVVPGSAVVERVGAKVVFVADGGKVRMTPVTLGKPFGDGFELVDGPAPGTKLVSDPPATLADGQSYKERSP
jgi:RND family efflux transporter MFP subunit